MSEKLYINEVNDYARDILCKTFRNPYNCISDFCCTFAA